MLNTILTQGDPPIPLWIDAVDPTSEELFGIAENYQLATTLVQDCLEPAHLPKIERYGDTTFLIIRAYDEKCDPKKDSVQSMTRKLAIFIGDHFLITVHRKEQPYLYPIEAKYKTYKKPIYLQVLLLEILSAALGTFHQPLEEMEGQIQKFETSLLKNQEALSNWEKVFRTKVRLTIIKRLLWHSHDTLQKFIPFSEVNHPLRQDLIERSESLRFFADSLLDDLNALLNIQLSLASHRANESAQKANEVMKVLTLFSAFFLPLNFIVGLYGMNFEFMPELKWRYGYFITWGMLVSIVILIYSWFVRKGWIRWRHLS